MGKAVGLHLQKRLLNGKVRAALAFLEKLTIAPADLSLADIEEMRASGVSDRAIQEAVYVCFLFSVMDRLADAFGFEIHSPEEFRRGGREGLREAQSFRIAGSRSYVGRVGPQSLRALVGPPTVVLLAFLPLCMIEEHCPAAVAPWSRAPARGQPTSLVHDLV
ncbi:MAG TPA: hypothetical protein VLW86_04310 [Syntrophorhabdales bacterium]|nr:hypothetical protein [Syntrophorhabdales bacterium]